VHTLHLSPAVMASGGYGERGRGRWGEGGKRGRQEKDEKKKKKGGGAWEGSGGSESKGGGGGQGAEKSDRRGCGEKGCRAGEEGRVGMRRLRKGGEGGSKWGGTGVRRRGKGRGGRKGEGAEIQKKKGGEGGGEGERGDPVPPLSVTRSLSIFMFSPPSLLFFFSDLRHADTI